jgi:hypothetical protein
MIREESSGSVQQRLQMITRNLDRRLERLEGHLKPPASRALLILVARIGEPNRIIELSHTKPIDWRHGFDQKAAGDT